MTTILRSSCTFFQQKRWFTVPWDQASSVIQWEEDVCWMATRSTERKIRQETFFYFKYFCNKVL